MEEKKMRRTFREFIEDNKERIQKVALVAAGAIAGVVLTCVLSNDGDPETLSDSYTITFDDGEETTIDITIDETA